MVFEPQHKPDSTRNGKRRFSFVCARMCLAMVLDVSWDVLGDLGAALKHLEGSWKHLGTSLEHLLQHLGSILGHLGCIVAACKLVK